MPWKLFEESVFNYLIENIASEDLKFEYLGNRDSTKGDIAVIYRNNKIFNIECKENKSQSSQFVLELDREKEIFFFSKKNKSISSKANQIICHMNNNFNYYSKLKKSNYLNNKLLCKKELLYEFVIDNLISKGSKFIATAENLEELNSKKNIIFFSTNQLENYFNIFATFRTKQSGSRNPNKENLTSFPYETIEIEKSKKKCYFIYDKNSKIPDRIGENFFLAKADPSSGLRKVRIRGKTKNHNVIFSLYLKKSFKILLMITT